MALKKEGFTCTSYVSKLFANELQNEKYGRASSAAERPMTIPDISIRLYEVQTFENYTNLRKQPKFAPSQTRRSQATYKPLTSLESSRKNTLEMIESINQFPAAFSSADEMLRNKHNGRFNVHVHRKNIYFRHFRQGDAAATGDFD